jgi:hypothetical protein
MHESALQEASEDVRLLEDSAVKQLKAICLEKIRTFAKSGMLSKLEKRSSLFSAWMLSLLEANSGTGNLALGAGRFSIRCEVLAPSY